MLNLPPISTTHSPRPAVGGQRAVLAAAATADHGVLLLVLARRGSTWALPGQALWAQAGQRIGWLSGGCLESDLEDWAMQVERQGEPQWRDVDTRADEDRLVGSGLGCRGLLRLLALPLSWLDIRGRELLVAPLQQEAVRLRCERDALELQAQARVWRRLWQWPDDFEPVEVELSALPRCALFGCGPESAPLASALRGLGWFVDAIERRPRWQEAADACDRCLPLGAAEAVSELPRLSAAILASHNFEFDHAALQALSAAPPPFVGLLGPAARRDELLSLLSPEQRAALQPVLRAPVGLDLGGRGAEAIALSISAQLEAWRHGRG